MSINTYYTHIDYLKKSKFNRVGFDLGFKLRQALILYISTSGQSFSFGENEFKLIESLDG